MNSTYFTKTHLGLSPIYLILPVFLSLAFKAINALSLTFLSSVINLWHVPYASVKFNFSVSPNALLIFLVFTQVLLPEILFLIPLMDTVFRQSSRTSSRISHFQKLPRLFQHPQGVWSFSLHTQNTHNTVMGDLVFGEWWWRRRRWGWSLEFTGRLPCSGTLYVCTVLHALPSFTQSAFLSNSATTSTV